MGLRFKGRVAAFGFWATVTWNVCTWGVLEAGSFAVTVMVEVSPTRAWVVSMWSTPLGLLLERVAELMVIGLIGCDFSLRLVLVVVATWVIMWTTSMPATTWPKFV